MPSGLMTTVPPSGSSGPGAPLSMPFCPTQLMKTSAPPAVSQDRVTSSLSTMVVLSAVKEIIVGGARGVAVGAGASVGGSVVAVGDGASVVGEGIGSALAGVAVAVGCAATFAGVGEGSVAVVALRPQATVTRTSATRNKYLDIFTSFRAKNHLQLDADQVQEG